MRGLWVWMYAAMTVCGCATAAPMDETRVQPNTPGPAAPMPGELPELLLMRGQVAVEVARVAGGEEVYLSLNDPAAGPMHILVQLEGEWPGAARSWAIADGTVKAWKGEGVTILDKASGETLLLWLTEAFRDAAAAASGADRVTPIQAYGWSAFWDWRTASPPGVLPEIDKCEPGFPCMAGGDPEADSCSIGGCPEPPTSCSVGGCVGQYCACCGCDPYACCRCVRPCGD